MLYSGISNRAGPIGVDRGCAGGILVHASTISSYPYPQTCIEGHFFFTNDPTKSGIYVDITPVRDLGLISRGHTTIFFFFLLLRWCIVGPTPRTIGCVPCCNSSLPPETVFACDFFLLGCDSRQLSLFISPLGGYLHNGDKGKSNEPRVDRLAASHASHLFRVSAHRFFHPQLNPEPGTLLV